MELSDLPQKDYEDLCIAKKLLEYPGLVSTISNLIGYPIEKALERLPKSWEKHIHKATTGALLKCLEFAVRTFGKDKNSVDHKSKDAWHKVAVTITGGVGGAFGFFSTLAELPVTTTIILRSIADIARSEGHDISTLETQLSCIEVFALGGSTKGDDASETGYWFTRGVLAREATSANIMNFIARVASRFSAEVSEEVAAKLVPVVGIVSGSAINVIFMNHFQSMARGHFIIKRLENQYGTDTVKKLYDECKV